jgi:hypothetical protein
MERIVQLFGGQQAAFQHDFADVLAGLGTDLADDVAFMVTDEGFR